MLWPIFKATGFIIVLGPKQASDQPFGYTWSRPQVSQPQLAVSYSATSDFTNTGDFLQQ